jgi:triacylglycerol lipase
VIHSQTGSWLALAKDGFMVARALLTALLVEASLLLAAVLGFLGGSNVTVIVLATIALLALLNVLSVAAVYITVRVHAAQAASQGIPRQRAGWRCDVGELLALFAAFVIIQPLEPSWMGSDAVGRIGDGRKPILLVHGFVCNRGKWWRLRRRLRARHYVVATINLEPPLGRLDEFAAPLDDRIVALLSESGADKVVLITHSMGGLVSRAYLQAYGAARVAAVITLSAPHHGTEIARLGCGRNAREMRPNSAWLRNLDAQPAPTIPISSIWSGDDEFVAPPESSRLASCENTILDGIGHIAMVYSLRVLACIEAELGRLQAN